MFFNPYGKWRGFKLLQFLVGGGVHYVKYISLNGSNKMSMKPSGKEIVSEKEKNLNLCSHFKIVRECTLENECLVF